MILLYFGFYVLAYNEGLIVQHVPCPMPHPNAKVPSIVLPSKNEKESSSRTLGDPLAFLMVNQYSSNTHQSKHSLFLFLIPTTTSHTLRRMLHIHLLHTLRSIERHDHASTRPQPTQVRLRRVIGSQQQLIPHAFFDAGSSQDDDPSAWSPLQHC